MNNEPFTLDFHPEELLWLCRVTGVLRLPPIPESSHMIANPNKAIQSLLNKRMISKENGYWGIDEVVFGILRWLAEAEASYVWTSITREGNKKTRVVSLNGPSIAISLEYLNDQYRITVIRDEIFLLVFYKGFTPTFIQQIGSEQIFFPVEDLPGIIQSAWATPQNLAGIYKKAGFSESEGDRAAIWLSKQNIIHLIERISSAEGEVSLSESFLISNLSDTQCVGTFHTQDKKVSVFEIEERQQFLFMDI